MHSKYRTNRHFTKRKLIHEIIHCLEALLEERHFMYIGVSRLYCVSQMACTIVINDCTQDIITACIVVSWITMFINFPFHRKSFVHTQTKIASQKQLRCNTIVLLFPSLIDSHSSNNSIKKNLCIIWNLQNSALKCIKVDED